MLNVLCSPRAKVSCIGRTLQKINHLLLLSNPESPAAADDILDVLIYVIITARPSNLLTTINFIELYYPEVKSGHGVNSYSFATFQTAVNVISQFEVDSDRTERNLTTES